MVRFAAPRVCAAACFVCLFLAPGRAAAQDTPLPSLRAAVAAVALPAVPPEQPTLPPMLVSPRRPAPLLPLYVSFGVLQVLDTHSTSRALANGGIEANPVMKGIAGNSAGLLAVKAGGTAGIVYASEKMWKKNRAAAVIMMVAANSAMIWVVQHNYQVR